jgi:hypothetical protein
MNLSIGMKKNQRHEIGVYGMKKEHKVRKSSAEA